MTAKEYLKQTWTLDREINTLQLTIEKLESQAEKTTTYLNPEKVEQSSSFNNSSREDIIIKLIEFKGEINDKIDDLVDLKAEIFEKIYKVENADHRMLLALRYIDFLSFEEIAVEMKYYWRHIIRKHGHALQDFERAVNNG